MQPGKFCLETSCSRVLHMSLSCVTPVAADCMQSATSICGSGEQECCRSLFTEVGVSEANAMAPLQLYKNAVEIKPYRVLLHMGLHFHEVFGIDTAFLNLTPFFQTEYPNGPKITLWVKSFIVTMQSNVFKWKHSVVSVWGFRFTFQMLLISVLQIWQMPFIGRRLFIYLT